MNDFMTISLAADSIGVSSDTIRRWEKKGLIKATRNEHNYRVFNIAEILRIHSKVQGIDKGTNNYKILKNQVKTNFTAIVFICGSRRNCFGSGKCWF
jgi:DNA (cytosine-5)-methyltransferase 1